MPRQGLYRPEGDTYLPPLSDRIREGERSNSSSEPRSSITTARNSGSTGRPRGCARASDPQLMIAASSPPASGWCFRGRWNSCRWSRMPHRRTLLVRTGRGHNWIHYWSTESCCTATSSPVSYTDLDRFVGGVGSLKWDARPHRFPTTTTETHTGPGAMTQALARR